MSSIALELDSRKLSNRTRLAQIIAQQLFSAHCLEEGVRLTRLADVSVKEALFVQVAELAVQMALMPDLEQTAVVAAADVLAGDRSGRTIFDHDPNTRRFFIALAQEAVSAYRQTLRLQPLSSFQNEQYCRLLPGGAK